MNNDTQVKDTDGRRELVEPFIATFEAEEMTARTVYTANCCSEI